MEFKGLTQEELNESLQKYGKNIITIDKGHPVLRRLKGAFINPFTIILFLLSIITFVMDVILASEADRNYMSCSIILFLVVVSGVTKFVQETRSCNAAAKLQQLIKAKATVIRDGKEQEILVEDIAVGDIVILNAGCMIPADCKVVQAKDFFISQSGLTGESAPVEKFVEEDRTDIPDIEKNNLIFSGTNVNSGSGIAKVLCVGNDTVIGKMAKELNVKPAPTLFDIGVNNISKLLIRLMLIAVPTVFIINIITHKSLISSITFAIALAVTLVPEMLPMIVTSCLAKGSYTMSKKKVIIKDLTAIQNLGSIDMLCTDKTGTLTEDRIVIEEFLDVDEEENDEVLKFAYLNSNLQTGLKNLIDNAIIRKQKENDERTKEIDRQYSLIDEIPFDFERRRMSVITKYQDESILITKGAVEEMIDACTRVWINSERQPLNDETRKQVVNITDKLNAKGMRVLSVAIKHIPLKDRYTAKDETEMCLIGFLALLDPPKESSKYAIRALNSYGVDVKVLTGDNDKVAKYICSQVGIKADKALLGTDVEKMTDEELLKSAVECSIYAKLSPNQKSRIVKLLRNNGHGVGYMGDGINDAVAMKAADVGISVDTAVDIAKESSKVILLEKDLNVLKDGIIEGRKVYANMNKYIKITIANNFGNMISVSIASLFLPFIPMAAVQQLLANMMYDVSCISLPFDNVDEDYIRVPHKWDAAGLKNFMVWFAMPNTLSDIVTFAGMFFIICPMAIGGAYSQLADLEFGRQVFSYHIPELFTMIKHIPLIDIDGLTMYQEYFETIFQSGWFVITLWTQAMVIHVIRTEKVSFIQSIASIQVLLSSVVVLIVGTILPFTPFGYALQMIDLPMSFFKLLVVVVGGYLVLSTIWKKIYIKRHGELL